MRAPVSGAGAGPSPSGPVALVQAPHAKACEPTPGLLALAAGLRARGVEVALFDANLEVQESLLSAGRLAEAVSGEAGARAIWAHRAARQGPEALARLRSPGTWADPGRYRAALDALREAWRLLSRHTGARFSASDLAVPGLSPLSSRDLLRVAREPALLPFEAELSTAASRILSAAPAVVGISAVYLSQALPAFALAGCLRRAGFGGRLVLGGGVVSSWAPRLTPASPVFEAWDALVAGPGEEALAALAEGRELADAPGLLAPGLRAWNLPATGARPPVCFEPSPEGLPWDRYPAPGPILPLAASRGCYWGRCAFCPEASEGRQGFQGAPAEGLADAVLRARDRFGFRHVHLTDDAVPPAALRVLARRLRGQGISWYGFARLDAGLEDPALCEELTAGGCAMLQLGVETASQRLLDLLGKGTRIDSAGRVLRNLAAAGIRAYVYLLFGAPTETTEEARATVDWASAHAGSVTFLNLALLNLPRGSGLDVEAGRYGVARRVPLAGHDDLSLYWSYEGEGTPGRPELRRILSGARSHPELAPILARTPPGFTSNHAAWAPLA